MLVRSAKQKLFLFFLCYLTYMVVYTVRINLSVAAPVLKELEVIDSAQLGILGSAFSIVYAVGRLINGVIGDRVRPSLMIFIGMIIAGTSNLAFSIPQPFLCLMVYWILNAFGQSMLWSSLLCVMQDTYGAEKAQKANSYLVTSVASGNIAAILLASFLIARFNVRWAFIVPGLLGILMGLNCLVFIRTTGQGINQKEHSAGSKAKLTLRQRRELIVALVPTMCHGAIKDNVTLWMSVIAIERCGIDPAYSAVFVLLIPVIGLVGRMLYSMCYRLCQYKEHVVSCLAFAVCGLAAAVLLHGNIRPLTAMIALGVLYAAASMINTSMVSIYPTRFVACGRLGFVSGLMDFVTYLGAGISSVIYGHFLDRFGYELMFGSWIAVSVLSALVLFGIQRSVQKLEGNRNENCS